jgi:hypothetical protein
MPVDEPAVTAERLRSSALFASRRAHEARLLALDIDVRRIAVGTRIDASVALHRAEVWNSRAAGRSREELQRDIGFLVDRSVRELAATKAALDRMADDLDDDARSYRRQASTIDAFSPDGPG